MCETASTVRILLPHSSDCSEFENWVWESRTPSIEQTLKLKKIDLVMGFVAPAHTFSVLIYTLLLAKWCSEDESR